MNRVLAMVGLVLVVSGPVGAFDGTVPPSMRTMPTETEADREFEAYEAKMEAVMRQAGVVCERGERSDRRDQFRHVRQDSQQMARNHRDLDSMTITEEEIKAKHNKRAALQGQIPRIREIAGCRP